MLPKIKVWIEILIQEVFEGLINLIKEVGKFQITAISLILIPLIGL